MQQCPAKYALYIYTYQDETMILASIQVYLLMVKSYPGKSISSLALKAIAPILYMYSYTELGQKSAR